MFTTGNSLLKTKHVDFIIDREFRRFLFRNRRLNFVNKEDNINKFIIFIDQNFICDNISSYSENEKSLKNFDEIIKVLQQKYNIGIVLLKSYDSDIVEILGKHSFPELSFQKNIIDELNYFDQNDKECISKHRSCMPTKIMDWIDKNPNIIDF